VTVRLKLSKVVTLVAEKSVSGVPASGWGVSDDAVGGEGDTAGATDGSGVGLEVAGAGSADGSIEGLGLGSAGGTGVGLGEGSALVVGATLGAGLGAAAWASGAFAGSAWKTNTATAPRTARRK